MQRRKTNHFDERVDKDGIITDLASGISKYFIKSYGEIDPEVIAVENGITYSYGDYGDSCDGMLEFLDGEFHIFINTRGKTISNRARFTFAHELGHFYIHEHANALINGSAPAHSSFTGFKSEQIIERQADHFAANLLMPEELVIKAYRRKRKFEFETIVTISKEFQVSLTAALYRVFMLDLHPMMIVKSKNGKIIGNPARSNDFYYKLNDKRNLPEDSLAMDFFSKGLKSKNSRELWAMDWFDTDGSGKVFEHCIYYENQDMVISVIWRS
ncbi:MAG: ImmA/IrrE family metallo-endopeptidase [Muricauda sp. TMED12]|nr:MAG: ImmA/IrrE family metallo-endopeptidase [Muricauda sp. TMED12]